MRRPSVRNIVCLTVAVAATLSLARLGPDDVVSGSQSESVESGGRLDRLQFALPPAAFAPLIRWWWPGGDVATEEIDRELTQIRAAGFAGVELQSFAVGLPDGSGGDVATYGTATWLDRVEHAATTAGALGLTMDLTLGSAWPTGGDFVTEAESLQQLTVTGQFVVGPASFDAPLPDPTEPLYYQFAEDLLSLPKTFDPDAMSPVAVIAARVDADQTQEYDPGSSTLPGIPDLPETIYLDPGSVVFLSDRITPAGRLVWDVPAGSWALFTFFGGPTGSRPFYGAEPDGGIVLDHFNTDATHAYLDQLGESFESRLGPLFGTTVRSVFVDSLELRSEQFWTSDVFDEFLSRRGYRLEPFLPILNRPFQDDAYMSKVYPGAPPGFEMRHLGQRVRYDYDRTLAELINERFFEPIRLWSEARGLSARIQAHGGPVDLLDAYMQASIPETEALFAGGGGSFLKMASSAAHVGGLPIVGSEVFAFRLPHDSTSPASMLAQANHHLASGVNQLVLHGFPYVREAGFDSPGWMPFDSPYLPGKDLIGTFGTRLNDRNPYWAVLGELNRYFARAQLVGRAGEPRADIALLLGSKNYPDDPEFEPEVHPALVGAGYDYDFVGERSLLDSAVAAGGLTVGAQTYRAVVVANAPRLSAQLAARLLEIAQSGVPVLFAEDVPAETPGYANFADNDLALASTVNELFGTPRDEVVSRDRVVAGNVGFVSDSREVSAVLGGELGVSPKLSWGEAGIPLRYVHRTADGADYYIVHNSSSTVVDVEVGFPNVPERVPEIWDLWSGVVSPAIVYRRELDQTRVQLHFEPHSLVVVGFERLGTEPHIETTELHAVRRNPDGTLTAIVTEPGEYGVVFAGGILDDLSIDAPDVEPVALELWDVSSTVREAEGDVTYTAFDVPLGELAATLDGFGPLATYSINVNLEDLDPNYLSPDVGLVLQLGNVFDIASIEVNGVVVDTLLVGPYEVEVTDYLGPGSNEITVTLTTDPSFAPSGLFGPAQLVPIYKAPLGLPQPLEMSVNVVPPNFPDSTNEDMLAAIARSTALVNHTSFQWFWKTPPNDANPEGGATVECPQVATWVAQARSLNLSVTLQFQTFFTQVQGDYALGGAGDGSIPVVQVATPLMPFETATFAEPAVRAGFLGQIACLAELEPEYLVLGPEVNFVYVFDREEWETFLPVYSEAYHLVKAISPSTQVGLSYQYDGMKRDLELHGDPWGYIAAAGPADFVALTSYYGFSEERFLEFPEPFAIPDDYYRAVRDVLGDEVPVIFSEIGWSSFFEDGETTQAEFIKRMPLLLAEASPDHVIWALLHDVSYFEGPGQSLNQSGLLASTGEPKPAWESALTLKDEAIFMDVDPHVFAPTPLPFAVTAAPPMFPIEPITLESGVAAIATAAELSDHVSFQFAWRDQVTGQTWTCDDIRPFVEEAQRRLLGVTLQFNSYTPVLSDDPDEPPAIVFSNPIDPPVPPFDTEADMKSLADVVLRDAYIEQVECIAELGPDYLVLGPEINFLAIYRPDELSELASVFRELYDRLDTLAPTTRLGTSIQYDILLEELLSGSDAAWIDELGTQDFVGLTTYFDSSDERHAKFPTPLDIPEDYYQSARARLGWDVPIVFTEVAWSSHYEDGLVNQLLFLNRLPTLFEVVRPANVIWGLQHDIHEYYSGEIAPLNQIGLRTLDGTPKPAWWRVLELRSMGLYRSP